MLVTKYIEPVKFWFEFAICEEANQEKIGSTTKNDMFRKIETLSLNVQLRKSKCNKDVKKFALIFYPFCTFSPYFPFSCQPSSQQFTLNSSLQLVCSLHSIQGRRNVKNLGRNKTKGWGEKKYTDVFKSGGNILGQSASKR